MKRLEPLKTIQHNKNNKTRVSEAIILLEKVTSLNKIEKDVLKIAEQIINKNKVMKIKTLYKIAKLQLNYSKIEISKAIYNLLINKFIFPGKKLIKSKVLINNKRKEIMSYIYRNPGAHLREIRKKLNFNPRVTEWHLSVLEEFEFIYCKKYLNYRVFFPGNFEKGFEEPLLALKNVKAQSILKIIYNSQYLNFKAIKKFIKLPLNVIHYHLKQIISSGIIIPYKKEEKLYFKVDCDKLKIIQKYLNLDFLRILK